MAEASRGAGTATHGFVMVNTNGTITYSPDQGLAGMDRFTYTISDGPA